MMERMSETGLAFAKEHAIASCIIPIVMTDVAGNVTYVNPAALSAWGYEDEAEVLGRSAFDFAEVPEHVAAILERVLASGKCVEEAVVKRRDGTTFDVELSASLNRDDRGTPIGVVASCLDITERKAAEMRLRESENLHRTLVENVGLGIALIDRSRKIVSINAFQANCVGRPVGQCVGQECYRVFEKRETICPHCPGTVAMATGEVAEADVVGIKDDGRAVDVRIQAYPVFGPDGQPNGFIEVTQDISERKKAEKKLAHFSAIVNSSQDAIYAVGADEIVTSWNPGAERLYGYTAEEMIGQSVTQIIPPGLAEEFAIMVAGLREGSRVERLETVRRRKDGSLVDVSITISTIKDSEGRIVGLSAIGHDITARKRAEEGLQKANRLQSAILENSTVGIALVRKRFIEWVNPQMADLFGIPQEEFQGAPTRIVYHDEETYQKVGNLYTLIAQGKRASMEAQIRKGDGTPFWCRLEGNALDPAKPHEGSIWIFEDISERKRAEEVLRASEERYRCLVENIDLGIALIDRQHRILATNSAGAKPTGMTPWECTGQSCFRLFKRRDTACADCPGVRAMETGLPNEVETAIVRHDGTSFAARVRTFPVFGPDGKPTGFIQVRADVTEQKRIEGELKRAKQTAEAASRAKSEFLANMSHEIRTPMTAILGFSDILLGETSKEEAREACQIIKRNGEHLLHVINDILDLSRIEAGKHELDIQACSPRQVAADVVSTMQVRADAKGLQLTVECDEDVPSEIRTDPVRLRQILVNLVGNAVKFTEKGSVRVAVRRDAASAGAEALRFEVIDTGIGIAREHLAMLFQPFSQLDGSARRRFGGTGLGLAISKRLAGMLGGDITVTSALGVGTTFTASITARPQPATAGPQRDRDGNQPSAAVRSEPSKLDCRILLAEDGPDNQRLIAFLLRKAGAEVTVVEDGQKAVALAAAEAEADGRYDLILMDMQMPVMDGYEATRKLRQMGYQGPILALTAHAMKEDRQNCLEAGCDDYVAKPIEQGRLLETIAKLIAARRSGRHGGQQLSHVLADLG